MDHELVVGVIVVVKTRLVLTQDKVWLKANDVMEEATELIDLRLNDNVGARVLFKVALVLDDLLLECVSPL